MAIYGVPITRVGARFKVAFVIYFILVALMGSVAASILWNYDVNQKEIILCSMILGHLALVTMVFVPLMPVNLPWFAPGGDDPVGGPADMLQIKVFDDVEGCTVEVTSEFRYPTARLVRWERKTDTTCRVGESRF